MSLVASDLVSWLKAAALYATSPGSNADAWGDKAKDSTVISPLAYRPDAQAEADAQAAFLSGPLAQDVHIVKGYRADLIGKCLVLQGDRLGYEGAGAAVFVIGAQEVEKGGTTTLTVLKRL